MHATKPTREEVMKKKEAKERRRVAALERQRMVLKGNAPLVTKQINKLHQMGD